MNSGAPASRAPPDFSSFGMIISQRATSAAYWGAEKYFGVYLPVGEAALSLWTIWWMYSAASAGMTCKTEPAAPTARVRRMSRRDMDSFAILNVALSGFVEEVFGSAPGERHDRKRRVLVRIRHKRSAIGDEKIFYLVGLAKAVEDGSLWVGTHARGANFVNDFPARLNSKGKIAVDGRVGFIFAPHSFDDGPECFLHVLGLKQFVVGPFEMEAQDGDAPLINDLGINCAVRVRVGNHLAATGEADMAAILFASSLF